MARTVDELRNAIRLEVNRFERLESTGFTKETLAALCEALAYDIDTTHLPPKAQMRAGIRWRVGLTDSDDPTEGERAFRKAELEAILEALKAD